ncbi:ADP-forming succinate--CoA ligase subunit beta [bacterium]|nr:ADP-forming succinate--CoA ligase subunit beta [bacterium]
MNLHEYQAKRLFAEYGIPVPKNDVASTADEAVEKAKALGGDKWVVKAQVHAGGRGKAGGVKIVDSLDGVRDAAAGMLGQRLVTKQTDAKGLPINQVLVEEPSAIDREMYLSVLVDRGSESIVFMCSPDGGMDIEEVAEKTPERIKTVTVPVGAGFSGYQARDLGFFLGLDKAQLKTFTKIIQGFYRLFIEKDAALVEINPLITTADGELRAIDGKLGFDDNALFRHPDIAAMADPSQEDAAEAEAAEHDLNYVTLEGNVGCMVNGAGLAMATMDVIKLNGGQPANFLDVGGAATAERVTAAFKLITSDADVKAILVNIFGGIVRCDVIAEGIIEAVKQVGLKIPVVARLEGTNVEKGRALLEASDFDIIPATDLNDAAQKVVAAAGA